MLTRLVLNQEYSQHRRRLYLLLPVQQAEQTPTHHLPVSVCQEKNLRLCPTIAFTQQKDQQCYRHRYALFYLKPH